MGRAQYAFCAFVIGACLAVPATAETNLVSRIAACTGKMSALLDHQRLNGDARAHRTRILHANLTDLFHAVVTSDTDRQARDKRTENKIAFHALLKRTYLPPSTPQSDMAARRAFSEIQRCAAMILPKADIFAATGLAQPDALVFQRVEREVAEKPTTDVAELPVK